MGRVVGKYGEIANMDRFAVGSVWICRVAPTPFYTVGQEYAIYGVGRNPGDFLVRDDRSYGTHGGSIANETFLNKYFTRQPDADESPIRTITSNEIVPGVYGLIGIGVVNRSAVRIGFAGHMGDGSYFWVNAEQLDAAASVLTQIAAVLRENNA